MVLYVGIWLFLACFFVWPILEILRGGFFDASGALTFAYAREVFANPVYREGLWNALLLGAGSTIGALVIALPLAWLADRYVFPGREALMGVVLLPIILPPFVGAIGIQQLLGVNGVLNTALIGLGVMASPVDWLGEGRFAGMIGLSAFSLYPVLYLNILAALANIDPALEEAAENLGCTGWRRFCRVTLPLMRPGIFAGATLVFVWAFTELGVPLMFNYSRITSVQIFNGLKDVGESPFPFALVTVMLGLSALCYALGRGVFGRDAHEMFARAGHAAQPRQAGRLARWAMTGVFVAVSLVALLPHAAVACLSFARDWYGTLLPEAWTLENYRLALGDALVVPAIRNSVIYAGAATVLSVALGLAIAFLLTRTRLRGLAALDALTMLPLAVPGIVLAFGYLAMSREGRAFAFLNPVENPTWLLIIAYAVRKLPFMVRAAAAGLQQTSRTYEEAAQNLGAPPARVFLRVTLPLIAANLLAGGLLVFAQSMLEVSDSLLLAQRQQFFPITKAIFELMGWLGDGPFVASALGAWAMLFLAGTILGASVLLGRRLGAIFRL